MITARHNLEVQTHSHLQSFLLVVKIKKKFHLEDPKDSKK